jgi:predicted Zn-dependent peptidase
LVDKTDAVQSTIRVGCVGIERANPDGRKLSVLNTYLGGYFRSQLSQKLREEKSYTYGVSSEFGARLFPGPFTVGTSVGSEVTAPAIEDILEEIKKVSTTLIPDDRFNEVKNYVMGNFPMTIQTPAQVAGFLSTLKLCGMPMNYYDDYIPSIQKITQEDLREVAKKYLDVSKMSIVVSGDNKTVAPTLTKFGKVEVVDADGNPIK